MRLRLLLLRRVKGDDRLNRKVIGSGGKIVQEKTKLPDGMGYVGEFSDPIGIVWGLHSRK